MPVAALPRIRTFPSRIATAVDAAAILACQRAALDTLAAGPYAGTRLREWAAGLTVEDHLPAIARGGMEIVEDDLGAITAFSEFDAADGHIPSLFVHPDFILQGLGSHLLRNIARQAGHHGIPRLTVYASLPAAGFYEKCGFTAEPQRMMHFSGGIGLPYIPMHLHVEGGGFLL
ncbi:GNAT family N-acetyltransferase [Luteolibacter ambystomatis]|uniref:GNAT family N-acetyltransferase n=1 Tax=Luteolibacter ambystomatis TaxID=2824561 RepID=A0A975PGX8_9BACT|nr:GNAT family N-acetyltransferase [Luteolibacter ambystomatis]QUE53035.1 GNAT family N-acetyltransferase [Luteolibacter ambystomatis]